MRRAHTNSILANRRPAGLDSAIGLDHTAVHLSVTPAAVSLSFRSVRPEQRSAVAPQGHPSHDMASRRLDGRRLIRETRSTKASAPGIKQATGEALLDSGDDAMARDNHGGRLWKTPGETKVARRGSRVDRSPMTR